MKIIWDIKHLSWQIATLAFFLMLWAKPFQIHFLLIIGYTALTFFEYSLSGGIYIDTIVWYTVIIAINVYWIYQDYTGEYHHPDCKIGH